MNNKLVTVFLNVCDVVLLVLAASTVRINVVDNAMKQACYI